MLRSGESDGLRRQYGEEGKESDKRGFINAGRWTREKVAPLAGEAAASKHQIIRSGSESITHRRHMAARHHMEPNCGVSPHDL